MCCQTLIYLGFYSLVFKAISILPEKKKKKSAQSARNSKAADSSMVENEQKALFIQNIKGMCSMLSLKWYLKRKFQHTAAELKIKSAD